jgi:hypothetical protein
MANKTLLITLVSFGLLLSAAAIPSLADTSTETVRAIEPDPSGMIAHYEFEGYAVDTSGFQPPANGTLFGNPAYVEECLAGQLTSMATATMLTVEMHRISISPNKSRSPRG